MAVSAGVAYVDIKPQLERFGQQLNSNVKSSLAKSEASLKSSFSGFGKGLGKSMLGAIGITFAAAGAFKFIGDSVAQARAAEEAQLKLDQAFKTFPKLANVSEDALRKLNTQMSFKTKFDDDALASGQAVLAQFKLTGQQIQEITPLVADYAARTGMDIPTAATALGRAFLGNTRALKTIGINFKATGNVTKDYGTIVDLLRAKVGGFAEAEGKTFSGRLEILHTQFGELKESVGRAVLPILSGLATFAVNDLLPSLRSLAKVIHDALAPAFHEIIAVAKALAPVLEPIGLLLGGALIGAIKGLGVVLKFTTPLLIAWFAVWAANKTVLGITAVVNGIKALVASMVAMTTSAATQIPVIDADVASTLGLVEAQTAAAISSRGFGASVLASSLALQTEATAATEGAAATSGFGASLTAALGPLILVAGAIAAVAVSVKAIQKGMAEVQAANKQTADSFLQDFVPALVKTGHLTTLTAAQWRSGPFGGSDLNKTAKVFDQLNTGVITAAEAFTELRKIAGLTQAQIDEVVKAQLASAVAADKQKGKYEDVARGAIAAFNKAGTSAQVIGESLRGLSDTALYQLQIAFDKAGIPANKLAEIMAAARPAVKGLGSDFRTAGKDAKVFAGLTVKDFKDWQVKTAGSLNFVEGELGDLGGKAKLTARDVIKAFDDQLRAMTQYRQNFDSLIARHAPADLLKQLADMGEQGAGLVKALADSNNTQFRKIIHDWQVARANSKLIPRDLNAAFAGIHSVKRHVDIDLRVSKSLQAVIEASGRGTVLKAELLGLQQLQQGGFVRGRPGVPVPIIAHGGEYVVSREMQNQAGTVTHGDTFNVTVNNPLPEKPSDSIITMRRRFEYSRSN